jgi:hypothetical protein
MQVRLTFAILILIGIVALVHTTGVAQQPAASPKKAAPTKSSGADKPLKLPAWWNPADPLPIEKSNCVRCHLTAGRELTVPLRDLARSAHDFAKLSCNDCHGGDTENDATAHEPEHHFIGTKLSAHMAACTQCHERETLGFRKSKHFWDLTKSINKKYPVCVDCHGNHDIGKPPADFALMNVCTDCHKQFAKDMPDSAAVVAENDLLWKTLRKIQAKNKDAADPMPEPFRRDRERVRALAGRLIHRAGPITAQEVQELNDQSRKLREGLEVWLTAQK